jgi:hypothetical protein
MLPALYCEPTFGFWYIIRRSVFEIVQVKRRNIAESKKPPNTRFAYLRYFSIVHRILAVWETVGTIYSTVLVPRSGHNFRQIWRFGSRIQSSTAIRRGYAKL